MLYMVIEKYRDADKVYRRFKKKGRMLPKGLHYIDSHVEKTGNRCFQLMETNDPKLFEAWTEKWVDLVSFEIVPVITSKEAATRQR